MSEDNEPLPPDLQRLLDAERDYPQESDERRARVKSALVKTIAIGAPIAAGVHLASNAASSATAATATTVAAAKAGLGLGAVVSIAAATFVVGGLTGVFVDRQISPREAQTPVTVETRHRDFDHGHDAEQERLNVVVDAGSLSAPIAPSEAPSISANSATPSATSQRSQRVLPPVAQHVAESPNVDETNTPRESTLPREREIVDVARAALVRNRPADALSALERHRAQFPSGQLAEERDALIVQAYERAGRADDAAVAASRFHAQYPHSLFTSAVDAALARARAMQER